MKKNSKKNPALVELILVILFFSLSSVILVQVFAKAKRISDLSHAETLGTIYAQSMIESWKADPKNAQDNLFYEGWTVKEVNGALILESACDKEMNMILEDSKIPEYYVQVKLEQKKLDAGIFYEIYVDISDNLDQKLNISFSNGQYVPDGRGNP